ncbi:hypothetical protein EVJ58_g10344 [Rhodofomes roseus]|uniref:Uncharacterized protein n=1 Tax=Rhodofomes roseus TaxID=34475 RepID=A0A4Y9XR48_9APHY|nr:hypothetical protein EVJ58_g10344 [Rhodofomes roseus]
MPTGLRCGKAYKGVEEELDDVLHQRTVERLEHNCVVDALHVQLTELKAKEEQASPETVSNDTGPDARLSSGSVANCQDIDAGPSATAIREQTDDQTINFNPLQFLNRGTMVTPIEDADSSVSPEYCFVWIMLAYQERFPYVT